MASFDELPIVLQLQHLAQKNSSDIEELLRRAKLVASKLKLNDLMLWCNNELMGYKSSGDLPDYRQVFGQLKVKNPWHGLQPFHITDTEIDNLVRQVPLAESIVHYVHLVSSNANSLQVMLPTDAISILGKMIERSCGMLLEPVLEINVAQIANVLTNVRNLIFNWALDLEANGILGEGMQFTSEEKEKAMTGSGTTYHIGNMQGVAGDMKDNSRAYQNSTDNSINNYNVADIKDVLTQVKNDLLDADLDDADLQVSTKVIEKVTQELETENPKKDKLGAFISMFPAVVEALPSVIKLAEMIGI